MKEEIEDEFEFAPVETEEAEVVETEVDEEGGDDVYEFDFTEVKAQAPSGNTTNEVVDEFEFTEIGSDGEVVETEEVVEEKPKEKDPEKEKRKKQILLKLDAGFEISMDDAQFMHDEFGYDYYQPDIDDWENDNIETIFTYNNINEEGIELTEEEEVTDETFGTFNPLNNTQRVYLAKLAEAGWDASKVDERYLPSGQHKRSEAFRNKILNNLNKDNWELNINQEDYGNVKKPSVQLFKDGVRIGAAGERQDLEMLTEAILMNNPWKERYEFEQKYGVDLAKVLGIPKKELDDWEASVSRDLSGRANMPSVDNYNELFSSYQKSEKFNKVRNVVNSFRGEELRTQNLNNILTTLDKSNYPKKEGYLFPLDEAIDLQTTEVLKIVQDWLPTRRVKDDAGSFKKHGEIIEPFNVEYAKRMRERMGRATTEAELYRLKDEWINYVKTFNDNTENRVGDKAELLYNPKNGMLVTREELDKGSIPVPIKEETLISEEDYVNMKYRGTDFRIIEQNMVDKSFEIAAAAKMIADAETNAQLHKVKGWSGIFRNLFGGVSNYDDVLEMAKSGKLLEAIEEIPPKYNTIAGVDNYNQLVRELQVLSKAYYMNISPLTFEQDATIQGIGDRFYDFIGMQNLSPDEQKRVFADMFQRDFPEIYNKFSKEEIDAFYETSGWRDFGVGLFDFGIIALEFAATRKLTGATINRIVNGYGSFSPTTGLWSGSGGLRGGLTRILGPNTGTVGRGYIDFQCLMAEEFLAIEGRNILTSFAPYQTERMNPFFSLGVAPFRMVQHNLPRILSNPNLVKGSKLEPIVNSINKFEYRMAQSSIPTATAKNVTTWLLGFGTGVTSLQTGTFVEHGILTPGWNYLSGNITQDEAAKEFNHALDHLTSAKGWATMTGQMLAIGGIRPNAMRIKARESFTKDAQTILDPKNQKYINNFAKNLGTDYKGIFSDDASQVQLNRIKKARDKKLKELGYNESDYANMEAAFDELGGFEVLTQTGVLKDFETFQELVTGLENPTPNQIKAIEAITKMFQAEAGQKGLFGFDNFKMSNFRDQYITIKSAERLNNIVNVKNAKALQENTEAGFQQIVNFNNDAKKLNPEALMTPENLEFIGNQSDGVISEMLIEAGWDQTAVSNLGSFLKSAREIQDVANLNGLKNGSDGKKKWVQSQLDIYDLNQTKLQLESQLKEVDTETAKTSIEQSLVDIENKINKAKENSNVILEESLANQKLELEKLTDLGKKEAGKYLEIYEDTKAFNNRIEELYKENKISEANYKELINKKRFNQDQFNEFMKIDLELKELQKDPEANAEAIKALEARQVELMEAAADVSIKGAHVMVDGKRVNLIDKEVMANLKSYTDVQHENLHHYFNDQFRKLNILDNEPKKREFIQQFKDLLPQNVKEIVERKLSKTRAYKNDPNTIEWLNVFAESLIRGDLDYTMKDMSQLAKHLETYLGKETDAKGITFTPREALEFIYEYAADVRAGTVNNKVAKVIAGQEDVELTDKLISDLSEVEKDLNAKKKELILDFSAAREGLNQKDPDFKKKFLEKNDISYEEYMANYKLKLDQLNKSLSNIGVEKTDAQGNVIEYNEKYLGLRQKNQKNIDIILDPNASLRQKNEAKDRIIEDNRQGTLKYYYDQYIPDRTMSFDDFKQEIDLKAYKALDTYDPSKGTTIHTHLRNHLKFAVATAIKNLKEQGDRVSLDDEGVIDYLQNQQGGGSSGGVGNLPLNTEGGPQIAAKRMLKEDFKISPETEGKLENIVVDAIEKISLNKNKNKPPISFKDISKATRTEIMDVLENEIPGMETYNNPPKGEAKAIRDKFLSENWAELYSMMPKNLNDWGDATGVANSLLKNFYKVGDRVSQKVTGTGVGTKQQNKIEVDFNSPIAKRQFIEAFEGRNGNTLFTALIRTSSDVMANQFAREFVNSPEGRREIVRKEGEEALNKITEDQYISNLLHGMRSGMSDTKLPIPKESLSKADKKLLETTEKELAELKNDPNASVKEILEKEQIIESLTERTLFSETDKELMESLESKAEDLQIELDEMYNVIGRIRRGDIKDINPDVLANTYQWLDEVMNAKQNKEASERFTGRVKKELFNDEAIQSYADQYGLTTKEAREVFDLVMGKGGMRGKKDGEVVWDMERLKYFEQGQKEFATALLEQFPEMLNLTKGNKGNEVLKQMFGIHSGVSGKAGSNKGGAQLDWWNPESYRGKEAKEVEWLSDETKALLKEIDFDKITIQNIGALGKIKSAIMGTPKGEVPTSQQLKIDNLKKKLDPETQKNLTAFYKFLHSAKIDYYESKIGKGLEEAKKAATYLYQLEQGNTMMVYGPRGLYYGKYYHLTEGRQDMSMENPLYKEYYDEALDRYSDYGENQSFTVGDSDKVWSNKYEYAKYWAEKHARIKGEHLFSSSDRSFEFLKSMFSGTGREDLRNLDFNEKIQIFAGEGYLKKIDNLYGQNSTYGMTRFVEKDLIPHLENIIDPLTGENLAQAVRQDAANKVTEIFKGTEYEHNFTVKELMNPLTRDQFNLAAVDPTPNNINALKKAIENKDIARKEQQIVIRETQTNLKEIDPTIEISNKELSQLSPVQLQALNEGIIKSRESMNSVEVILSGKEFNVFDGDEVLWTFPKGSEQKIKYTLPDGKTGELTNQEFNHRQKELEAKGATFDYSVFNTLEGAVEGPAFKEALKRYKESPEDFFISTARAPGARKAIIKWMNEHGFEGFSEKNLDTTEGTMDQFGENLKVLNTLIPLFTGERSGVRYAKGNYWDDHHDNVDHWGHAAKELDLEGTVNLVVEQKSRNEFSEEEAAKKGFLYNQEEPGGALNLILQETFGIPTYVEYSAAKAKLKGKGKGTGNIIPPNAQDFEGLLYATLAKGKVGERQLEYYQKTLIEPYATAERNVANQTARISSEYKDLTEQYPSVVKNFNTTPEKLNGYTLEQSLRIFAWDLQGKEVDGVSKTDLNSIRSYMRNNPDASNFAHGLIDLSHLGVYEGGGPADILAGNIQSDLLQTIKLNIRENEMATFNANIDAMFTEDNLRKLEGKFGPKYRSALEDMIRAMKTGKNRNYSMGGIDNNAYNFVNNANGALMALNFRSATLQLTSTFNYLNWSDNNAAKAAMAFSNQPQFWKDFSFLWKELYPRREGNQQNIAEAEIADYLRDKPNKGKAIISYLINKGYTPTKIADSFAIAFGGASMYRNRVKSLMKKGMSQEEATEQALLDWREETERHQQSRRPDKVGQIQRTLKGRIMLGFHTTQMQYARMIDKSFRDIKNGRGNLVENVSRILNYGVVQPVVFNGLQLGAFMMLFQDESEEGKNKKFQEVAEGSVGSLVEGTGTWGVVANVLYKAGSTYYKESQKERPQYYKAALKLLDLSPSLGGKVKMGLSAMYEQMYKDPKATIPIYHPDNPNVKSGVKIIQMLTNLPLNEAHEFYGQLYKVGVKSFGPGASKEDAIKVLAIGLGWPEYILESQLEKDQEKIEKKELNKAIKKAERESEKEFEIKDDIDFDDDFDFGDDDFDF